MSARCTIEFRASWPTSDISPQPLADALLAHAIDHELFPMLFLTNSYPNTDGWNQHFPHCSQYPISCHMEKPSILCYQQSPRKLAGTERLPKHLPTSTNSLSFVSNRRFFRLEFSSVENLSQFPSSTMLSLWSSHSAVLKPLTFLPRDFCFAGTSVCKI